jgi:hypothetical protein
MRRYKRRVLQNVEYKGGYRPGNIVVITALDIIRGTHIGIVAPPRKECNEEEVPVYINDNDLARYICINIGRGHTILRATKQKGSDD